MKMLCSISAVLYFFASRSGFDPKLLSVCLCLLYSTTHSQTMPLITSLELHQMLSGPLANLEGTWCVCYLVYVFVACLVHACLCLHTTQWISASLFLPLFVYLTSVYMLTVILQIFVPGNICWGILEGGFAVTSLKPEPRGEGRKVTTVVSVATYPKSKLIYSASVAHLLTCGGVPCLVSMWCHERSIKHTWITCTPRGTHLVWQLSLKLTRCSVIFSRSLRFTVHKRSQSQLLLVVHTCVRCALFFQSGLERNLGWDPSWLSGARCQSPGQEATDPVYLYSSSSSFPFCCSPSQLFFPLHLLIIA